MAQPFQYRFRVRYHECDGQKVVFNARYGEYIDVAAIEFVRVLLGSVDPSSGGIDWRLVRQEIQWKAPAHFDDILSATIETTAVGNTSFTLCCTIRNIATTESLATATTTYVVYDEANAQKAPVTDAFRELLLAGAVGRVTDCVGM